MRYATWGAIILALLLVLFAWTRMDTSDRAAADSKAHVIAISKISAPNHRPQQPPVTPLQRTSAKNDVDRDVVTEADKAVIERLEANIMGNRDLLNLTDDERSRLIRDVTYFQDLRREIEKTLMSYKGFDGTAYSIQVGAYPEIGTALKARFEEKLKQDFPFGRADVLDDYLGNFLEAEFKYFGQLSQTFHVSFDPAKDDTVLMWETARVATADHYKVPQEMHGTAIMGNTQFVSGEYAGIAEVLKKHLKQNH